MKIIFEKCILSAHAVECVSSKSVYKLVASPKALAAQTFRSKNIEICFLDSKLWEKYSDLFNLQIMIEKSLAPVINNTTESQDWINYPYAVLPALEVSAEPMCAVWFDPCATRNNIRHVRIYSDEFIAISHNIEISRVLSIL